MRDRRVRRRVLHGVLHEVLQDLAEPRRIGQAVEPNARHDLDAVAVEDRMERRNDLRDDGSEIDRADRRRALGHDADRREDRVDETVEPFDLLERRTVPRRARLATGEVARLATAQRRLVGEQVGVGTDDGQRGPQLVGDQRDQLAARFVDRLERLDAGLCLALLAALLDDPREQVGDGPELRDVVHR